MGILERGKRQEGGGKGSSVDKGVRGDGRHSVLLYRSKERERR